MFWRLKSFVALRQVIGVEYELLLQRRLAGRGVPFESEDELRSLGLTKTPDVRLGLPVGVQDPRSGQWREVNWIDSKALFGDKVRRVQSARAATGHAV